MDVYCLTVRRRCEAGLNYCNTVISRPIQRVAWLSRGAAGAVPKLPSAIYHNDDVHLAAQLGAGFHLGQADGCLISARQQLGAEAVIGATCHAQLELAAQALEQQADYIAFGRFYNSQTKPGRVLATAELLHRHNSFSTPIVAIGGIALETAAY